jgi:hypothetical protein
MTEEKIMVERLYGEELDSLCDIPNCPYMAIYRITGKGLYLHLCEYHAYCEGFI